MFTMNRFHATALLAASLATQVPVEAASALRCELAVPSLVMAGKPVPLRITVFNPAPVPMQVLRWNTPFEGTWLAPFVDVYRTGLPVPYRGVMAKRSDPVAQNYLRIEASGSASADIDLAAAFELGIPGSYQVRPRLVLADVHVAKAGPVERLRIEHHALPLNCPAVSFTVKAVTPPPG